MVHKTSEFVIIVCLCNCSGSFNEFTEGQNISSCIDCTAGYYCPTEGRQTLFDIYMKYKQEHLKFISRKFILEQFIVGTYEPLPCGKGNYSYAGSIVCDACEPGYYCPDNATSFETMSEDYVCIAGVECPEGMNRAPDLVNDACRKGHYCPRGDVNPLPVPCPNGTFNQFNGSEKASKFYVF